MDVHGTLLSGGPGRPKQHASDVLRASLVLAVAALDAFVLDCVVEAVPAFAKAGALGPDAHKLADSQALLGLLAESDPHEELRKLARAKFERTTFQKSTAIEAHLRGVLGVEVLWGDVAANLGLADGKAAREALDVVVRRRDRIAHAGDLEPGTNKTAPINKKFVEKCHLTIMWVGAQIDFDVSERVALV